MVLTIIISGLTLWTLPFLIIGIIGGDWAHYRMKETFFTKLTYILLLVSSVFMFI